MNSLIINTYVVFVLIFNVFLIRINAKVFENDVTTSPTPSSTLQRSTSARVVVESDGLTKRDIKTTDLSTANTVGVAAKSYDPPPEFYRGPGSTGHFISTVAPPHYNNNNYKPLNAFISRPIAFPDTHNANNNNNYNKYNGAGSGDNSDVHLANSYNSWQHLKGKVGVLLNKKGALQDRISVGHYGTSEHGGSSSTNGGYAYENRPYGVKEPHVEYIPSSSHYGGNLPSTAHTSGYYGSSAVAEGIPFDVYGSKNHYSSSGGGDYASYSYSEGHEHKSHPDISQKALLAKSFLIPLASAAVLGIAAALVSNPLLLQLGTVSGLAPSATILGKRKRRDLTTSATTNDNRTNSLDLALTTVKENKKDSTLLPYRAHHRHFVRT